MKILTDNNNILLNRREVSFAVESETNPGLVQAISLTAQEFKAAEELIAIKAIRSCFGSSQFIIEAFAYNTPEDKMKFEPKPKEKKKEAAA